MENMGNEDVTRNAFESSLHFQTYPYETENILPVNNTNQIELCDAVTQKTVGGGGVLRLLSFVSSISSSLISSLICVVRYLPKFCCTSAAVFSLRKFCFLTKKMQVFQQQQEQYN
uniref:Uncharacterized protein n=1 Tax=Glossina pallidipes TaxID=7398 RepID=A0A1B0A0T2_GLOPL